MDVLNGDLNFSGNAKESLFYRYYNRLEQTHAVKMVGGYDVFGDGSVLTLPTPGHSPGHRSLYINLAKTGPVVISGDLYHFT